MNAMKRMNNLLRIFSKTIKVRITEAHEMIDKVAVSAYAPWSKGM